MKSKDSKLIYEAYKNLHEDASRAAFEDAFWYALKRGDMESARRENEILNTSRSIPGQDIYGYEGWDGVQAGVEKGISEEILRAFFYPEMGDLDWSAGYNYILTGVGPGDDGAGARGAVSRQ